jgi:hypothetical protein
LANDPLIRLFSAFEDEQYAAAAAVVVRVRIVLAENQKRGVPFAEAWYTALRAICPPRTCQPELRAEIDAMRDLIHEVKPHFQAAYESRTPTLLELKRAEDRCSRRLDRLLQTEVVAA